MPRSTEQDAQHARDVYAASDLPNLVNVEEVIAAPKYDPEFSLADCVATVLFERDPILCTEMVKSTIRKIHFSSKQISPEKFTFYISRRGKDFQFVYKDESQVCRLQWKGDGNVRNWTTPKEKGGPALTETQLKQSRRIGQELLLKQVWKPTGAGSETETGLVGKGTRWFMRP